jgi:two-component system, OmpR family, response regulator
MSDHKPKILLAEDDLNLGMLIQDALAMNGYEVHLCTSGSEAMKKYGTANYDLCILDVMMPQADGYEVARNIRKTNAKVPIFFLTAKSETQDKIEGFRAGADDYLTKPFSTQEFLLRVEALLRRSPNVLAEMNSVSSEIAIGKFKYDSLMKTLSGPSGVQKLTKKEAAVIAILADQINKPVEKEVLLNRIWGSSSYFNGRSLDVYITRIRKYLSDDASVQITNQHGVGFMLKVEVNPTT